LEEIISFAEKNGLVVSKECLDLLANNKDWEKILLELADEGFFFIEPFLLEKKLLRTKISQAKPEIEIRKTSFSPQAKDRSPNFRIMSEYDVTGQSNTEGKVDDFLRLFKSKLFLLV